MDVGLGNKDGPSKVQEEEALLDGSSNVCTMKVDGPELKRRNIHEYEYLQQILQHHFMGYEGCINVMFNIGGSPRDEDYVPCCKHESGRIGILPDELRERSCGEGLVSCCCRAVREAYVPAAKKAIQTYNHHAKESEHLEFVSMHALNKSVCYMEELYMTFSARHLKTGKIGTYQAFALAYDSLNDFHLILLRHGEADHKFLAVISVITGFGDGNDSGDGRSLISLNPNLCSFPLFSKA